MSLTPSLKPPISEPLEPQHPTSKLGIHTMTDLTIHQDPKEDLWIAVSSHPNVQETIENARGRNVTGLYSQCRDQRIEDHPDFKKLRTMYPEPITEEYLKGSSSSETAIASQPMEIRVPVALTTNKAPVEDLLDDYLPLNERPNEELKDDMQEEVIEEAQEEEDDDEGCKRKKREGKTEMKANKGFKRAKKQKPAGLEEREGGLDTHRGRVTLEAVRRSKRLRERYEVIIVQKEEELAVSRKADIKEASGKETAPSVLKSGRARPKKVIAKRNFEPKPKLKLTAKQAHLPEGSQCSLPRLSKQKVVPTITSQSLSSTILGNGRLKIKVGADIAHFPAQVQRRLLKSIERPRLII